MSLSVVVELVALAVALVVGIASLYAIFEMRELYSDHRDKFLRVITAVETFQSQQKDLAASAERIESDGHALQAIAIQFERMIAALDKSISAALISSSVRQSDTMKELRDHLDEQESKLAGIAQKIAEVRTEPPPEPAPPPLQQPERTDGTGIYMRLGRDALNNDAQLRFALLRDWIAINILAIMRRAGRPWLSPKQLIIGIPDFMQAEAEVLDGGILLVGTRGHGDRLAVPIKDLDSTAPQTQWFEFGVNGSEFAATVVPAVLARSNGSFEVVHKGAIRS